jgi:hypothetical protein
MEIHAAKFEQHLLPVCFLTLRSKNGLSPRQKKLQQIWGPVLRTVDVSRFFFYGINGKEAWGSENKWRPSVYESMVNVNILERFSGPRLKNLQPSEVAITLGFYNICKAVIQQGLPHVLYLEDDSNLFMSTEDDQLLTSDSQRPDDFRCRMVDILDFVQTIDWDIVRLGGIFSHGFKTLRVLNNGLLVGNTGFCLATHGVLLSNRAARVVLEHAFPMTTSLDHSLLLNGKKYELIDLEVLPHIIGQDFLICPDDSLIGYSQIEKIFVRACWELHISPAFLMKTILQVKKLRSILYIRVLDILSQSNKLYELTHAI